MFGKALNLLGVEKAFVVHGHDGMDEMTTTDLTRVTELNDGMIKTYDVDPMNYFGEYADPEDLKGGDVQQNAAITRAGFIRGGRPETKYRASQCRSGACSSRCSTHNRKGY